MTKQEAYCAYLTEWAESHRDIGFEVCSPACFGEWLMSEGAEYQNAGDDDPSIAPCDVCRDGPTVIFDELDLDSRYEPFIHALKECKVNICRDCFDAVMADVFQPCHSVVVHLAEGMLDGVYAPEDMSSGFYIESDFDNFWAGEQEERFSVLCNHLRAFGPGMRELI